MNAAKEHDVVLIPFGGGSNIAGCLENRETNSRMVVSLDMKRMDRVLDVDEESCVARIQAGSCGPIMEEQLTGRGFTLGHFPDSFEFSTVGGWVATRSAGMQSDKYGKIEDMVLSVRMVTPSGVLVTRTVPKSSNGIDVNHICIGSEGILGVITEISLQVHRLPEKKEFYGYLFPDFESGVKAMRQCVDEDCMPTIARLNDPGKTALSFAFKGSQPFHKELMGKVVKKYLAVVRGFDMDKVCLMIMAVEGDNRTFRRLRSRVHAIYRKHGAFKLGISPGRAFQKSKYDFPYLRDFAMDRGVVCDVSETSTVWSNLLPLYHSTIEAIEKAIEGTGVAAFAGCHISHCYHTGTSLYFTFACMENESGGLGQYLLIKKAAEDAFLRGGATLSHHHAVGFEHAPWLEEDISETGVLAVRSVKEGLDPGGVMNPGKILPDGRPFEGWGLEGEEVESLEGTGN
jgi:alkyldihydroxyacetonephosphate synthase